MFGAVVLVDDPSVAEAIEQLALVSKQVIVHKSMNHFPPPHELVRVLNTYDPDLVFLDVSKWDQVRPLVDAIREHPAGSAIVAYGPDSIREFAPQYAEAGVGALLTTPLNAAGFKDAVDRAIHKSQPAVEEKLLAFLPAKAGSGASTVVLNTAGSLAEIVGQKVVIVEADLNCGVLSVLLNATPVSSMRELLEDASSIDFSRWANAAVSKFGIDVVMTDRMRRTSLPTWSDYHQLLQFALPRYDSLLVDLPELINDATGEIVRRARSVYIVTTQETPALMLALQRCEELESRGVPASRIVLVLNRWQKEDKPQNEIEKLLGRSVYAILPNDYRAVQKATSAAKLVDSSTELGKAFSSFARKLAGAPEPEIPPESKGFLNVFRKRA